MIFATSLCLRADSSKELDSTDVVIMANYYLSSKLIDNNKTTNNLDVDSILPLYSSEGNIVAYYIDFLDSSYAVINNNKDNPEAIEFGFENSKIKELYGKCKECKIVYNSPTDFYFMNEASLFSLTSNKDKNDLYDNYPDLNEKNDSLSKILCEYKTINTFSSSSDWGFINSGNLPTGEISSSYSIPSLNKVSWVSTGDFSDIASNHCGAVAVTNLALYFSAIGYTELKKESSYNTFVEVHKIVGNGPTATIADKAKTYFKNCGYTLKTNAVSTTFHYFRMTINANRPCAMLLTNGVKEAHWIIGVGYIVYKDGGTYMRIVDGWNHNSTRYYKGTGSNWISATGYWIG